MYGNETPYTDDALNVENGTRPEELREFTIRRAKNPIRIGEKIVWNFNNHEVDFKTLERQVQEFYYDEFIIPFQTSGAWAYMASLLPPIIREAEILAYDRSKGKYNPYPNIIRHSSENSNERAKEEIVEWIQGELDRDESQLS